LVRESRRRSATGLRRPRPEARSSDTPSLTLYERCGNRIRA
jgi:hypothetical protein